MKIASFENLGFSTIVFLWDALYVQALGFGLRRPTWNQLNAFFSSNGAIKISCERS
jgi:hypothetical protein